MNTVLKQQKEQTPLFKNREFSSKKLVLTLVMGILGLAMIVPFLWMFSSSFKILSDVYKFPMEWISKNMNLENYKEVLFKQSPPFSLYYWNSIKISVICVAGDLLTSSMAGYAFAKLNFKGRDIIFMIYLIAMMIPFQVIMVPQFIMFKWMGIYNTHWALILPKLFTPLGTFMMRQYFMSLPQELIEAGRIDGMGEFGIFFKIMLPLAKPVIATLSILSFVWRWNDYEAPLVFLSSRKLYTLTLGLTNFIDESGMHQDNLIMAAAVAALFPMLLMFFFGQKYLIEGMTSGSVKQ